MKLSEAKCCVECETLFEEGDECPRCNSKGWGYLSRWMSESHKTIGSLMESLKAAKAQLELVWKETGGRG